MRDGMNPNRKATVDGYAKIVLAVITHLPTLDGYHENRLDVVKCSLETMRINAQRDDFQVMVWDNGSCDKLRYWLRRSYQPDYLITSPNVGKSIARASIVKMLPAGTYVGVADDDMYYYPGWLEAHIEVLDNFPRIGTISGWPVRTQFRFHNKYTLDWARRYGKIYRRGRFISEQEDRDFCTSIGRDYKMQVGYTRNDCDVMFSFRDIEVYATGHHAQWMGISDVVGPHLTYTPEAMPSERPFEQALDSAKLLRLTTFKRYTRHIGNVLDKELEEQWQKLR